MMCATHSVYAGHTNSATGEIAMMCATGL